VKPLYTPQQKKVLFFDVNQTLVMRARNFEDSFKDTWKEFTARWDGGEDDRSPNPEEMYDLYRTAWQSRGRTRHPPAEKQQELQEIAFKEMLDRMSVPVHGGFARSFFSHVRAKQMTSKTLYPHVKEILTSLAPHYKLAIISNSRKEDVSATMHKFGLTEFFPEERWFTAVRLRDKKPNTKLFIDAMRALGVMPRQCVMIGNSYRHDVLGAFNSGIDAIWVQRSAAAKKSTPEGRSKKGLVIIRQLDQLLELFKLV
jgi:putative hydrolase of the HAD superfamily